MVVGEAWHAECRNCDVSRPVPANVMLCRSQPRCVALRLVVSCPCLKLCSHNCGVRVPACSVICPNTEKESSGADTWAQVLRHEREHLVVNASDKSGMRAQRHYETHNGHSGCFVSLFLTTTALSLHEHSTLGSPRMTAT